MYSTTEGLINILVWKMMTSLDCTVCHIHYNFSKQMFFFNVLILLSRQIHCVAKLSLLPCQLPLPLYLTTVSLSWVFLL